MPTDPPMPANPRPWPPPLPYAGEWPTWPLGPVGPEPDEVAVGEVKP